MKAFERIEDLEYELANGETYRFADHPNLKALEVIFEEEDECVTVDFCVPTEWLLKEAGFGSEESLDRWLQNEYTSEDSERILHQACWDRQLHIWRIH